MTSPLSWFVNPLDIYARATNHQPLTPNERAFLKTLQGLWQGALASAIVTVGEAALAGGKPLTFPQLAVAGVQALVIALIIGVAKLVTAHGDSVAGTAIQSEAQPIGEQAGKFAAVVASAVVADVASAASAATPAIVAQTPEPLGAATAAEVTQPPDPATTQPVRAAAPPAASVSGVSGVSGSGDETDETDETDEIDEIDERPTQLIPAMRAVAPIDSVTRAPLPDDAAYANDSWTR